MKMLKNNTLQKLTVFLLVLSMFASLAVFPVSAQAASKKTIPKSFANKDSCITTLKTFKLASLKKYGDKRIDTRLKSIETYPKSIDKTYSPYERAEAKAKKSTEDANKLKAKFARHKKAVQKANPKLLQDPVVQGRKDSLLKEVADTKTSLNTKKNELSKASSPSAASEVICYVMFDLRVYSYLGAKIKAQKKVDSARLQGQRNQARYNAIQATYEANKTNKKYAKKVKKIEGKIKNLQSPQPQTDSLNALQKRIDSFTIANLNSSPEAAKSAKADLLNVAKEASQIAKTSKTQAKSIDSLYNSIKRIFKKTKGITQSAPPTEEEVIADPAEDELEPDSDEESIEDDPNCNLPYCLE